MASLPEIDSESAWTDNIEKATVPVVVKFYASWCAPCQELDPVVKAMQKEFPEILFFQYNVDKLNYWADKFNVTGIPHTLLMRPDSVGTMLVIEQIKGYLTADMLRPKIKRLLEPMVLETR